MRYTNSGTPVVTFGMATNKSWKDEDGETKEIAEFHSCMEQNGRDLSAVTCKGRRYMLRVL